jgi:hypothetical protein
MSICHSCIGSGRCQRAYDSRGRFGFRSTISPWRTKMPLIVRVDGTTQSVGGRRSNSRRMATSPTGAPANTVRTASSQDAESRPTSTVT